MMNPEVMPGQVWRVRCEGREYLVTFRDPGPTWRSQRLHRSQLDLGDIEKIGEWGARNNLRELLARGDGGGPMSGVRRRFWSPYLYHHRPKKGPTTLSRMPRLEYIERLEAL